MREPLFIYGKHAALSAISNSKRKIDEFYLTKDNKKLYEACENILNKINRKIKCKFVNSKYLDNLLKKQVKHQGIVVKSYKIEMPKYSYIFDKNFKNGIIIDSITDPNNVGAIYRSARAFGFDFVINSTRNSILENSALINVACGAFDAIDTYKANNISIAIKKLKSEGWWIVGLDHIAKQSISDVLNIINENDKFIFILGSEGKGIKRLIKENCHFLASIPNVPNTNSINVSNAAAISFYEVFKKRFDI